MFLVVFCFLASRVMCQSLFDHLNPEINDYCLHEYFNVTCAKGQVLLVISALYGRMKAGRCANGDYSMGCSIDVLVRFNRICGGRTSCSVPVRSLLDLHPCQKDYMSYLEASHVCVRVNSFIDYNSCRDATTVNLNNIKTNEKTPTTTTTKTYTILIEYKTKSSKNTPRYQSRSNSSISEGRNQTYDPTNRNHKRSIFDMGPIRPVRSQSHQPGRFLCWWRILVDAGHQTIDAMVLPFSNDSFVSTIPLSSSSSSSSLSSSSSSSSAGVQSEQLGASGPEIANIGIRHHHPPLVLSPPYNYDNWSTPCTSSSYINIVDLNNNNINTNYDDYQQRLLPDHREEMLEICLSERNPTVHKFETTGSRLTVGILPQQTATALRILVTFKANGCRGPAESPGFWHERMGNMLNWRCLNTQVGGNLTCVDGEWKGDPLNCTLQGNLTFLSNIHTTSRSFNGGTLTFSHSSVLAAVFFGAGFGVMLGLTLLVSLYCARRRYLVNKRERGELLVCGRTSQTPVSCCFSFINKRSTTSRSQVTTGASTTPASDREVIMFLGQADIFTNPDPSDSPMCHLRDSRLCVCCENKVMIENHRCIVQEDKCSGCSEDLPEILFDHRGPKWRMKRNEGSSRAYYSPLVSSMGRRPHNDAWDCIEISDPIVNNSSVSSNHFERSSNCTQQPPPHNHNNNFYSLGKNKTKPSSGPLHRTCSTTMFSNFQHEHSHQDWNKHERSNNSGSFQPSRDMCSDCSERYLKQRKHCDIPLFVKPLELKNLV